MPIYKKKVKTNRTQRTPKYERILCNETGKWKFTHLEVQPKTIEGTVIHHVDFSPENNNPTNLQEMTHEDHWELHSKGGHALGYMWENHRDKMVEGIRNYHANRTEEQTATIVKRNRKNGARTWQLHEELLRESLKKGQQTVRNKFDTYEEYCAFMRENSLKAKAMITDEMRQQMSEKQALFNKETKTYKITDNLFSIFIKLVHEGNDSMPKIKKAISESEDFNQEFFKLNKRDSHKVDKQFSQTFVYKLSHYGGYENFKDLKENYNFNHQVVKVEVLSHREDTGCLTIKDPGHNHNFATEAGVYIKNSRSDGKGSRVETLPGGQGLGELADLEYFMNRVYNGLRVPTSFRKTGSDNAIFNDGKMGQAYIEELRFAKFVERMQGRVEQVLDTEFKKFIHLCGIHIDETLYKLTLPPPSNFGTYRQQELDSALLSTAGSAESVPYLAKRFVLSRYLQLDEDEMALNEKLLREEKNIRKGEEDELAKLYNAEYGETADLGVMGGLGPELQGGGGLGDEDMDLEGEGAEGAEGEMGEEGIGPEGGAEATQPGKKQ